MIITEIKRLERPDQEDLNRLEAALRDASARECEGEGFCMPLRRSSRETIEDIKKRNFLQFVAASREKLIAMTAYLLKNLGKKREVSRVALYKLLFYCDFAHYKKYGKPISGIPYVHLKNGPVPAGNASYDLFDGEMRELKVISVREAEDEGNIDFTANFFSCGRKAENYIASLSTDERATIGSIIEQLASKTSTELKNISHKERAYTETKEDEVMDYEYASELSISV